MKFDTKTLTELVSPADMAKRLGWTHPRFRHHQVAGNIDLPAVQVGKRFLYTPQQVERIVAWHHEWVRRFI